MKSQQEGHLKVGDGHEVYYAVYGNMEGKAIITIHGGPGSMSKSKYLKCFDLSKHKVILFDQRGCGKSTPQGEVKGNTTQNLISDMECLREHLEIEKWYVSGGSWGSTLALIYAESHADRVLGLLLCSIWLARDVDDRWSFVGGGGVDKFYPDVWERRMEFLRIYGASPENAAPTLLGRMENGDEETKRDIAAGVANWESNLFSPMESVCYLDADDMDEGDISSTKIFLHYQANSYFLDQNQILRDADKIKHIPTVMAHGRYDVLCPMDAVWELSKRLTNSRLVILPSSGHNISAEGELTRNMAYAKLLEDTGDDTPFKR
ncbi:MAG: prolyl aminopeptidase [Candidatus Vogelbacteria bacterium CG10_big_fil_rev_8_21_14_0_10_45_14]|uniref:Proline iminopeptidase n=1 Tax=Candidatus Vogelbacteria bacterium CG10_big_fil_rev_8_21_14_0_10_45_14 TaxID=1975042 RepID=A0A2H0RL05_9BACT|nr:MAG: prolyl aminopeptidase [Candidatus Vogelbacteria bacterium CG10_big_fil_rev_8_21_14_0_10_45_14]